MTVRDPFDVTASQCLIGQATLALTTARVGRSHADWGGRQAAQRRAMLAYSRICKCICLVRMNHDELAKLGFLLEELRAELNGVHPDSVISHK